MSTLSVGLTIFPSRRRSTGRSLREMLNSPGRVDDTMSASGEECPITRSWRAITAAHLTRACDLEGIDGLGLGPTERQYLHLVAEGASRLNVVSSMLGLPTRTVAQVIEPYLLRTGLVVKDDTGRREVTARGRDHLSASRLSSVKESSDA
ncbi:MAG TPA: Holliday junction DNA helicase RuvB C-terminal domain-containing protein [Fimbriiglobus sp.]|nr:Holliday junction DNA helicase RuvB C-terminal domain-containing protein [Fimbriiglobus sp.]